MKWNLVSWSNTEHTKTWVEQIEEMLDSEIELDAKMAVQKGFVDKVI